MGGRPVLIVDDDTMIRRVLERALAEAKFEYVSVGSGAEALAHVNKLQPSLVLLDLVLPELDGYKILHTLRARPATRDLPVVVLTALESEEAIVKAFEAGADDYVRKPFKTVELVARVRSQLRLRTTMDALARREKDAQLVLELTQALASNLDFRGILFTVVRRIAEVVRVDRVSIVLVRNDNEKTGYVVAASDDEELRDLAIDLTKYPEIRQVLASGEPLVVEDAGTHPLMEIVRSAGKRRATFATLGILPILYEGRPMGVLFLRSRRAGAFGARELAVCRTITSAMAIALRNARILQSLRDHTQQETEARFAAERRMRVFERYADFFNSSADGIIVIDKSGRLLFGNPKSREISGYDTGELRGESIDQIFVTDEELARVAELRDGFARGIFPRDVDLRIRAQDGRILILNVSFASVLREEGVVLCSFRDVTHQREIEGELVKTKDSLRRVIDASADAIISCDTEHRIVLFNRAAERLFGRASEDVIGINVSHLHSDGAMERLTQMIRDGGGRVDGVKAEIIDASGTRVPVSFSGALVHEGNIEVGSVGILTDLREKMRMEQRLQQAQERILAQERQAVVAELAGTAAHELNQPLTSVLNYATLLRRLLEAGTQAAEAAAVIEGQADRMAEIVRKIGTITKYETKDYVGKQKILDLDRACEPGKEGRAVEAVMRSVNVINAYERVTVSSLPFSRETSSAVVSGIGVESTWLDRILVAACEVPVEAGESAVASFFVRTVAEIFPTFGVGACLVSAPRRSASNSGIAAPSIGEQRLFKYAPNGEEHRGEGVDPARLFPGYAHERVLCVQERGSTLHVASDDASLIASDSPVMFIVRRVVFAMNRWLGLARLHAKATDDARELRTLTSQMIQAEKLASLGQIAAGIVHELNNPLTSIVAYTGWLLRTKEMKDDPDSMERLRRIEESSNRILRFTRDLVAYARPSSEVAVQVSLEHVIEQALAFCEHIIAEHGVVVDRRFSRAVPDVRGMPEQLVQVFVNLLTNACHAMPAHGGVLSIELTAEGSRVRAVVEDNGHGIASEHMSAIFAPFFTTRVDGGGTGLGLSIVKNILDHHGAEIWAEQVPSGGARFVLVFK